MRKLVTVLVLVVGFAFTSCSKDTCDADEMIASIDGQTGSLSLSSLGVDVKEEGFGTSNESGRSIGEPLYEGELVITVGGQTLRLSLIGSSSDIEATIAGQTIDGIPYGNHNVSVSITASDADTSDSRLEVVSSTPSVIIGSSPADVNIILAPADAYLDVVATISNDVTSIVTSFDEGYIAPGVITVVATATDVNGNQYVSSVELTLEAAKAYTVNFNASVDLNGGVVINATVTGFTNVDAIDGVFNPVLTQIGGQGFNVLATYVFSNLGQDGAGSADFLSTYWSTRTHEFEVGDNAVIKVGNNVFKGIVSNNIGGVTFGTISIVDADGISNQDLGLTIYNLLPGAATIYKVQ